MRFDREACKWVIIGPAADIARSDTRGKILTVLKEASDSMTAGEIMAVTKLSRANVD
jgi:hypothetical protein